MASPESTHAVTPGRLFRSQGKCIEVDTSQDREAVYALVRDSLAEFTDDEIASKPLTERAEILLGRKPYPEG